MDRRNFLGSLLGLAGGSVILPHLVPSGKAYSFLGNILRRPEAAWTGTVWIAYNLGMATERMDVILPQEDGTYRYSLPPDVSGTIRIIRDAVDPLSEAPPVDVSIYSSEWVSSERFAVIS